MMAGTASSSPSSSASSSSNSRASHLEEMGRTIHMIGAKHLGRTYKEIYKVRGRREENMMRDNAMIKATGFPSRPRERPW